MFPREFADTFHCVRPPGVSNDLVIQPEKPAVSCLGELRYLTERIFEGCVRKRLDTLRQLVEVFRQALVSTYGLEELGKTINTQSTESLPQSINIVGHITSVHGCRVEDLQVGKPTKGGENRAQPREGSHNCNFGDLVVKVS